MTKKPAKRKAKTPKPYHHGNLVEALIAVTVEIIEERGVEHVSVREAAKRTIGQRHFDVQLIGGMVLHDGRIAEMKTGEGKTLVATLAVYLNALEGKGVHVVTVNDYLAKRDAAWMGKIYGFLGLTTGVIVHGLSDTERRQQYACDVTYATNNELGFDYLRDNMKMSAEEMVQFGGRPADLAGHHYAIVDEVDSILVDEARTPLIISGPVEDDPEKFRRVDKIVPRLIENKEHFTLDEKARSVQLTEEGVVAVERLLAIDNLYAPNHMETLHVVQNALRAHIIYKVDVDYVVKDDQVIIVDEFTGRLMEGRRWSDGLHQAVEAKEKVKVQNESQTYASITFQNYFRMYEKLAGMTGTALTEADEFTDIYNLEVLEVPTNMPMVRIDDDDEVYRTAIEKYRAILTLIDDCKQRAQPVLVGTTSIEKSEQLAEMLRKEGWEQHDFSDPNAFAALYSGDDGASKVKVFAILNARFHEQEAQIISQAGVPGAVTIATNMAGRGTDIQLGGNIDMRVRQELKDVTDPGERDVRIAEIKMQIARLKDKALNAGGLFVLGTERHESRRIDNQLRGRSGRQGDPGHSKFFLSLEDDLMRIFGSDKLDSMLQRLGLKENEAIVHSWINKALEKAQQKVEFRNFDIRKNLLKYDNVSNDQRKVIFDQRVEWMKMDTVAEIVTDMRHVSVDELVAKHVPENAYPEQWDTAGLKTELERVLGLDLPVDEWAKEEGIADEELLSRIERRADEHMASKVAQWGAETMRAVEKTVLLQTLDHLWREHLVMLEHLRNVVGLRGYGQRDPLNEYKAEAYNLFEAMSQNLREQVTGYLMRIQVMDTPPDQTPDLPYMEAHHLNPESGADYGMSMADATLAPAMAGNGNTVRAVDRNPSDPTSWGKVGRNEVCPCGSGKKFKHCHGRFG